MPSSAPTAVVTGFITSQGRVLLLRRSSKVGTYQGHWAGVSGYLETDDPTEQVWTELGEELGIGPDGAAIEITGDPLEIVDRDTERVWLVHPFRFSLHAGVEPRLDWEHVEMRWASPDRIQQLRTVPGLWEAWCRVSTDFDSY